MLSENFIIENQLLILTVAIVFSAYLGNFANAVIFRLPKQQPIWSFSFFCPQCMHSLSFKQLLPIFSYLIQKGTCSFCKKKIPMRYLFVECLFIISTLFYLIPNTALFLNHQFLIYSWVCIIMFFTDIEHCFLSFKLNLFLIFMGIFYIDHTKTFLYALALMIGLFVLRFIFNAIYRRDTFGIGDILFICGICMNWGMGIGLMSFYLASILGGLSCAFLLIIKRKKRFDTIPFGPYLIVSFLFSYFIYPLIEILLYF